MAENEKEQQGAPEARASTEVMAADLTDRPPEFEPTEFREGFTFKTMLGALFVGFIMMPGSIYLGLVVGQELGPAAEWTTIILFTEVARRSFTSVTRQELYLIYYMAGALAGGVGVALAGGPFAGLIWSQYFRQSPAAKAFGIADKIPLWVSPPLGSSALTERSFMHHDWLVPIILLLVGQVLGRMQWIGLGYPLFRMTSDIERLPYPFAPIQAQGATALAEVSQEKESWRWPVFSVGAMIGMAYGTLYVFIPILTGAVLTEPVQLIKIPFIDLTSNTEGAFPASQIGLGTELGGVLSGFVIPYPIVVGSFIGSMVSNFVFTPTVYRVTHGAAFEHWRPGMSLIQTQIATSIDFWLSIGIGINVAFAAIGLAIVIRALLRPRGRGSAHRAPIPEGRGDFPIWAALAAWLFSATFYVGLAHYLINILPHKPPGQQFPLWIIVVFGLLWSPLNSYVSARLVGMTGRGISIPYLAQASFILSGYKGVDIWFAPIPLYDYGGVTQKFREIELTGTKFVSVIKAEAFMLLLMLFCSFVFWSFFWKLGSIPSSAYPYAQTFWPLSATMQALWATATSEQNPWLLKALKPTLMGGAFGGAMVLYAVLGVFRVPVMWFYGLLGGFQGSTTGAIPSFIGAMLSRFYFAKRFGLRQWRMYGPVLLAGYACGTGLVGMAGIALAIILKSVRVLPF